MAPASLDRVGIPATGAGSPCRACPWVRFASRSTVWPRPASSWPATCGILLVHTVMLMLRPINNHAWRMRSMPVGLVSQLAFGVSAEAGLLAAVVGLAAAMLPWERWRSGWPIRPLHCSSAAIPWVSLHSLPVSAMARRSGASTRGPSACANAQMWAPFGIWVPGLLPTPVTGHAHDQVLESLATGGWHGSRGSAGIPLPRGAGRSICRSHRWTGKRRRTVRYAAAIFQADVLTFRADLQRPDINAQVISQPAGQLLCCG